MKKHVVVKQKHRYTNERNLMFEGTADVSKEHNAIQISYMENDGKTMVHVLAADNELHIKRKGEVSTSLHFCLQKTTTGHILSEFGIIDIEVYTHKYIKKDNVIAIEYDILVNGEVSDGYRIIWTMKEDWT